MIICGGSCGGDRVVQECAICDEKITLQQSQITINILSEGDHKIGDTAARLARVWLDDINQGRILVTDGQGYQFIKKTALWKPIDAHFDGLIAQQLFEDGIFERIGAALSSDAKDCVIRLLSEPNARESSLPSIPLEVSSPGISASSINFQNSGYRAEVDLPPHLICGFCNDVVVGACILDCNCKSSVVCKPCWENRGRNQDDSKSNRCPSCQSNAELKAYCHALDAAILHIIESLPADSEDTITLKQGYYARLSDWRPAVSDRNDRQTRMVHVENELSTRRSREENADRKHPPKKKATAFMRFSRASLKVIATVFAPLIAAAAALVALKIKRKMIR